jgi:hypothetical protein
MTDGVDTAVEAIQAPGSDSVFNRPVTQAEVEELADGNHSVLEARDRGDRAVDRTDDPALRFHRISRVLQHTPLSFPRPALPRL